MKKNYKFKLKKDKKGFYIVFSKAFEKDHKLKENQNVSINLISRDQFFMEIGKDSFFVCDIK